MTCLAAAAARQADISDLGVENPVKQLLVMRHAKSSWDDESLSDHDRPLNGRGRRVAPLMGQYLVDQKTLPDLVLSSTAMRAATTAHLVVEATGQPIPVGLDQNLYAADIDDFFGTLAHCNGSESTVMVVSHNPGVERCVHALTGKYESMPTAAIAVIELDTEGDWHDIDAMTRASLAVIWRPKEAFPDRDDV